MGQAIAKVCLFGTTSNGLNNNCFPLGMIAKSVTPGNISFPQDIVTGVISHFDSKTERHGLCLADLECLIIPYKRSPKTGKTTPTTLRNVTNAIAIRSTENANQHPLLISTAEQPSLSHRLYEGSDNFDILLAHAHKSTQNNNPGRER